MPLGTQAAGGVLTPQTLATLQFLQAGIFPTQGNLWFVNANTGNGNWSCPVPLVTLSNDSCISAVRDKCSSGASTHCGRRRTPLKSAKKVRRCAP